MISIYTYKNKIRRVYKMMHKCDIENQNICIEKRGEIKD